MEGSSPTWKGGTSALWSNAANWENNTLPGAADSVCFDDECQTFCNVVIDTNVDIQNINLKPAFSGSLTQSSGNTITLGTDWYANQGGFTVEGGTFVGSSSGDFIDVDFLRIGGGSFTSTRGELRVGYNASFSESNYVLYLTGTGVFNHNNGHLILIGEEDNSGWRFHLGMTLDQPLNLYDFTLNVEAQTQVVTRGLDYNSSGTMIVGTSRRINVANDINFLNGHFFLGEIYFSGSDAYFACDGPGV